MSSVNCTLNSHECPYHPRITIEHESAELRLKKEIIPEFPLDVSYPFRGMAALHAMLESFYTPKGSSAGLALIKGAACGFLDALLSRGLRRFKWRQIDPQKLSEISFDRMYAKNLMIIGADTALKIASICTINSFLGITRLHFIVHVFSELGTIAMQTGRNTAEFIAAKRALAKFDELNHLYHHYAAEGTERVEKAGSLDEHRLKSLNEALKIAALRMDKSTQQPANDTANEINADDLVDVKTAARITAFFAAIRTPPPKKI